MSKRLYQSARRLLALEQGAYRKDWGGRIPVGLVYPNHYRVGMANLGFLTVYQLFNENRDIVCERIFLPTQEEELEMVRTGTSPFSLESQRPLNAFEILAFSVSYENDYPHIVKLLTMAGIPPERRRRSPESPLLMAGGPAVFLNPEALAEIIDVFFLGEAEEVLEEFLKFYRKKRKILSHDKLLPLLPEIEGLYVPALYQPVYEKEGGPLSGFEPKEGAPPKVRRRWVKDLDRYPTKAAVVAPDTEFPGVYLVELGRGCRRRCRFCSTGHIYQPARYRRLDTLKPLMLEGLDCDRRLGLVCASFGDYPQLAELFSWLHVSGCRLSAPSLRIDTLSEEMFKALGDSGQKSLTLAPEAGSERLRRRLNKFFSDEDILNTVEQMTTYNIFGLRLYFMVGLPDEEEDDIEAIIDLTRRIRDRFLKVAKQKGRMGEITLSINPFVPKPWSAFQWCAMAEESLITTRLKRIRLALQKEPNITVVHGPAKAAYLQALFSRGDRRVFPFVLNRGTSKKNWKQLYKTGQLNPDFFVYRERPKNELFPWDFIDHGISKKALYRDYERCLASE